LIEIFYVSLILGMITGLLAGMFGIGGGSVIVPALVMVFTAEGFPSDLVMIMAIATSLAAIISSSISSVLAHNKLGSVLWGKVARLTPGIFLGALLGAVIAEYINAQILRYIVVFFLFYMGFQILLQVKPTEGFTEQKRLVDYFVAVIIGLVSAIIGIGGGSLTVPYLVHGNIPMRNAVAIASACGLPIALSGTLTYALLGLNAQGLPEASFGYVSLPAFLGISLSSIVTAPIGAKLAHSLPVAKLKRYFSLLLFLMAAKMLWH
jgi:uncharacterized membrane protein YfcA